MTGPRHLGGPGPGTSDGGDQDDRQRRIIRIALRPRRWIWRAIADRIGGMRARGVPGTPTAAEVEAHRQATSYQLAEWLTDLEDIDRSHKKGTK